LGQSGTASTVRCIRPTPVVRLPGQVPVEPLQRRPDQRALGPASRYDFTADRFSGTAQPLAHHCGLMVSRPPPQEMNTVDADPDLGMVAEVDQGFLGSDLAAVPASAFACLAYRRLVSVLMGRSRLLAASVGARP